MKRDEMIRRIESRDNWDILIIGGGATGLGCAIESASRGYDTLLLEKGDFAQGTSSRSTKLVHGGVRYLQQGNISLVLEALKERGLLHQNAPHLVSNLKFVVPNYDWWEGPFYGIGLKLYDMLAGKHGFGRSKMLSVEETIEHLPTIETEGLLGGIIYHDGQFDDARLAINMAQTAAEQGATVINYMEVTDVLKSNDVTSGVVARDVESDEQYHLQAKVVVNATGPFTDVVRQMDEPDARQMIQPSQGVHIVLDQLFLPGESAIMVPHTADGRVLFAIPWHNRVVVGTTDTPIDEVRVEPRPFDEELDFLVTHAAKYLTKDPTESDVLSAFAGIRPLVRAGDSENTSEISRDHTLHISKSGLVTIAGGKWTTYRKMAEDTINQAATLAQLEERPTVTPDLAIHGYHRNAERFGNFACYGADAPALEDLCKEGNFSEPLIEGADILKGQVVWAVRHEMCRTVTDFLSRRTRMLLLDARKSIEMAPVVASILADELDRSNEWQREEIDAYNQVAAGYLIER